MRPLLLCENVLGAQDRVGKASKQASKLLSGVRSVADVIFIGASPHSHQVILAASQILTTSSVCVRNG
jgi:hypothetical protein